VSVSHYDEEKSSQQCELYKSRDFLPLFFPELSYVELNNDILNENVFERLLDLILMGNEFWFHPEVFKPFKSLRSIEFVNKHKINVFPTHWRRVDEAFKCESKCESSRR
jgi:hypothetical protein